MIIEYRGRQLEVKDQFVEDYNRFNLSPLDQTDIDVFIFKMYIKDTKRENEIPEIANTLSDEEILKAINYSLKRINRFYFQDLSYGEE